MHRNHGEERPLLAWLISQEKVISLWIEDALAEVPADDGMIAKLEMHRAWLCAEIELLIPEEAA
ncbi:MAG: hypothetical protein AAGA09_00300 [Pseudomonadota bacterium]